MYSLWQMLCPLYLLKLGPMAAQWPVFLQSWDCVTHSCHTTVGNTEHNYRTKRNESRLSAVFCTSSWFGHLRLKSQSAALVRPSHSLLVSVQLWLSDPFFQSHIFFTFTVDKPTVWHLSAFINIKRFQVHTQLNKSPLNHQQHDK